MTLLIYIFRKAFDEVPNDKLLLTVEFYSQIVRIS